MTPETFLGDPLPSEETAMWAALSVAQRAKALQRMAALERWHAPGSVVAPVSAAMDAGVSLTRMYEMGKAWRNRRSLASLGTFAGTPKTRVGDHDAAIRRVLGDVVAADPTASVRKLALDLEASLTSVAAESPSHNTLRRYVEGELRRREREETAGNDLMLDCSACTLTPSDNVLLTAFVILDRATQVIVGAGLGDVAASRAGYARAAGDGLRRIGEGQFSRLRWADRMARGEIVAGTDEASWADARATFARAGVEAPIEIATSERRFGRYLRPATGLRIGTVSLAPARTSRRGGEASAGPPTPDQQMRLSVEVDEYNVDAMSGFERGSNLPPPADLPRLLTALAAA